MLQYESGIFGLPLRLLAREVYDKCVEKIGLEKVALITGEEKFYLVQLTILYLHGRIYANRKRSEFHCY